MDRDESRRTQIWTIDPETPEKDVIAKAAELLCQGGLVAFPTETVYGLGANAWDVRAVKRIFVAKGRPAHNPLIVHVAESHLARLLVNDWPPMAQRLADRFWPGPLTLVLPKAANVPEVVTAGGPNVAIRCPAHPVAFALLAKAAIPIAAPSANRSTELSPTRAEHVLKSLGGRIDLILDAGPCSGGIESTVLDLTSSPPCILRPGLITPRMLEPILGCTPQLLGHELKCKTSEPLETMSPFSSPGQMRKHYAPRARLVLVKSNDLARRMMSHLQNAGWLSFGEGGTVAMPTTPADYAARLYDALHQLDDSNVDVIIVTLPPAQLEWYAVHDRLRRAASDEPGPEEVTSLE